MKIACLVLDARWCELGSLLMEDAGGLRCRKTAAQPRDNDMLRITVTETAVEERWILQGQLTKRSVAELVSSWRASLAQPPSRCRIVDLNEVTSIDKSGEEALLMMVRDGATFVASGVYTKHLLDQAAGAANQSTTPGLTLKTGPCSGSWRVNRAWAGNSATNSCSTRSRAKVAPYESIISHFSPAGCPSRPTPVKNA